MKKKNKGIYGSGFLISEKAAAEKAAAEKWELSEREKEIVKKLSNQGVEDEKREANVLGS
jgi:hypothetical protein